MIWEREKKVLTTLTRTYKCFWLAQKTITDPLWNAYISREIGPTPVTGILSLKQDIRMLKP